MRKFLFTLIFSLFNLMLCVAQNPVLDGYIRTGIENNNVLKQRQLDYTKSLLALKEARGYFFPEVNINARYTVANGGRVIEFPVGDLLNPVYNTLNLLTASNQFPEIANQEFTFYRAKEQETKVSVIQPIFNSDLIQNVRIKEDYSEMAQVSIDQYKRELIKEIKSAYYNYQKAFSLGELADSTILLVKENLRVSSVLYKNDLVTIDVIYRSEAEVSKVEAEVAKARSLETKSRAYFNFLLNKPLDSGIEIYNAEALEILIPMEEMQANALENREEFDLINRAQSLNNRMLKLQRGAASPDLFAAIDYGFQGEEYRFTNEDDFVLASVVLRWNLFQGMTNRNKIRQTLIEGEKLDDILSDTEMKVRMQVMNSYFETLATREAITAAEKRSVSANKAFRLIDRKYKEGQATLLEYIDARTNYTSASAQLIMARSDYFISLSNLEFANANFDVKQY